MKWFALWLGALVLSAGMAFAENRVALVIGNSAYHTVSYLPNAAKDARDVSAALRGLGFDVIDGYDMTQRDMLQAAQDLQRRLQPGDVAVFYFAGHGVQLGSENFIVPVDAHGVDIATIKASSVSLQTVLKEMEQRADRNIIILDACRNNPFEISDTGRSIGGMSRGLAKVDAGVGSFIAFSTQPGNVALDGDDDNSPFTQALLRHLPSHRDDLHEVMRKVRKDVVEKTGSVQIPWENSSLIDRIYLAAPGGRLAPSAAVAQVAPAAPAPQIRTQPTLTHQVAGLNPNGDGFLALRTAPTTQSRMIAQLTEGTRLSVLEQVDVWFHVRADSGLQGWAHSNWIRFQGAAQPVRPQAPQTVAESCDSLWYDRNVLFARNGYCFKSARGRAAFSNASCVAGMSAGDTPLSRAERREVSRLIAREKVLGCR